MEESTSSTVRAVSYLRVSSVGQIDGDGFARQRETVRAYADRHGIELVGEYRDEGVSGTVEGADRDGFRELLGRIAGNCVRVVLVERADRLARDLLVQETLLRALIRLGVRVVEASSGVELTDESDPSRILIRQVLGAVAEHDKACLVAKLRKARQRKRELTGRCEGRIPFGFRAVEREGLVRITALWKEGKSSRSIAATLNAEGIATRTGKPWTFATVAKIARRQLRGLVRSAA
jgi:DNA invertase Pin-like site-specific DNA recombinase